MNKFSTFKIKPWHMVLIICLTLTIPIAVVLYQYYNPKQQISYQAFEPIILPAGLSISNKEVRATTTGKGIFSVFHSDVQIFQSLNKSDSFILQKKSTNQVECPSSNEGATCEIRKTTNNEPYALIRSSLGYEEAWTTKGTTSIQIRISQNLTEQEWQQIVESLTPIEMNDIPVEYIQIGL